MKLTAGDVNFFFSSRVLFASEKYTLINYRSGDFFFVLLMKRWELAIIRRVVCKFIYLIVII